MLNKNEKIIEIKLDPKKKEEELELSWVKNYWRPAIAWQYFAVCLFDFIIAPILNALYFWWVSGGTKFVAWDPLSLKVNGFYHMAMGAILGVAAWTRGQEKIHRIQDGYGYGDYERRWDRNRDYVGVKPYEYDGDDEDEDDEKEKTKKDEAPRKRQVPGAAG